MAGSESPGKGFSGEQILAEPAQNAKKKNS